MSISDQLKEYRPVLYAGEGSGDGARGTIQLTGTTLLMSLRFVEPGVVLRPAVVAPISVAIFTTFVGADMPIAHWATVIDLLRNETPLYFGEDSGRIWIATTPEPVGEGEAQGLALGQLFECHPCATFASSEPDTLAAWAPPVQSAVPQRLLIAGAYGVTMSNVVGA